MRCRKWCIVMLCREPAIRICANPVHEGTVAYTKLARNKTQIKTLCWVVQRAANDIAHVIS